MLNYPLLCGIFDTCIYDMEATGYTLFPCTTMCTPLRILWEILVHAHAIGTRLLLPSPRSGYEAISCPDPTVW